MDSYQEIELSLLDKSEKSPTKSFQLHEHDELEQFLNSQSYLRRFLPIKSYFEYLTFQDAVPTVKKINASNKTAVLEDIPFPFRNFNVPQKAIELDKNWQEETKSSNPSILRALYKTFKPLIWRDLLITFIMNNCHLIDTVLMAKIIRMITDFDASETDEKSAYLWGICYAMLFLTKVALDNWFFYFNGSTNISIKFSIIALLYKKLNCVSLTSIQKMDIGKVINLMANDVNELDFGLSSVLLMIMSPYNVLVSCYLLSNQLGWLSILALLMVFGSMQLSTYISNRSKPIKAQKNLTTDTRIRLTNELIECIRLIKLYAWEKPIRAIISSLRLEEAGLMTTLGNIDAMNRVISEISVYFCLFFLCILYVWNGNLLTPEKVYAAASLLFVIRRRVLWHWTYGRHFVVSAKLLVQRVEDILAIPEVIKLDGNKEEERVESFISNPTDESIIFKDYFAYWSKEVEQACLKNINTVIPSGKLTVVIGTVGSGKTTLLLSLLSEIPKTYGHLIYNGSLAYVEQEPIVFSLSIRDNILFGKEYDEEFYKKVLFACNLDQDLRQFDHGDQTIVGERGVTLSGGQKVRLSLARALYSQSDIYLLDDPLSAVDSKVANHIFLKAIRGLLKDKTVILVTHHLNFAKQADKVIVLNQGEIEAQGSFEEVQSKDINLLSLFTTDEESHYAEEIARKLSERRASLNKEITTLSLHGEVQEIKHEEINQVTWETYKKYLQSSSDKWALIYAMGSFALAHGCIVGLTRVLGYWASEQTQEFQDSQISGTEYQYSHTFYIFACTALITIAVVATYIKGILLMRLLIDINTNIHMKMLHTVSRAVIAFFDETPVGRILNRFSSSLGTLDKAHYDNTYTLIDGVLQNLFFLIYICLANLTMAIPGILVVVLFFKLRDYYAKAMREVEQLDFATRSPIYSEISSTLNGLVIIRLYRQGIRFIKHFLTLIHTNSRVSIFHHRLERLFGFSLFALLWALVMSGTFIFIYGATRLDIDAGLFGMALYYLIVVGANAVFTTKQSVFFAIGMQNAENILQYCELPQEPADERPLDKALMENTGGNWPQRGEIEFRNVYLRYKNTNTYALNGLTFSIPANFKVGIVGRTGAGKSSLIQALFRMVEIEDIPSSMITIDGVNTKELGLQFLRRNLSIIPQTPVLFTGTIRKNLDPFEEYTDARLWEVLDQVRLKDYVDSLDKKLDTEIGQSSSVFSAGQKQLMCLARVILKKKKIMVFDEATANVDYETDAFIQEKMKELFNDCTILTVAHRLMTIAHYDRVMVLDKGVVVEFDHPYVLLVEKLGDRRITRENGYFAKMVLNNGEKVAESIFKIAYNQFNSAFAKK